jgi:hypothetical protein
VQGAAKLKSHRLKAMGYIINIGHSWGKIKDYAKAPGAKLKMTGRNINREGE